MLLLPGEKDLMLRKQKMPLATVEEERGERVSVLSLDRYLFAFFLRGNQLNPALWHNNPMYQPPPPGLEAGDQRPNLGLGAQPTGTAYAMPRGYKVPDFAKFSAKTNKSMVEHIGRFTVQCGEVGANDFLKMRHFTNSLLDMTWQQMEEAFHSQFYRIAPEVSVTDLFGMYQIAGEMVEDFIACFKRARYRCPLVLPEPKFIKLAENGLEFEMRMKFVGMDLCILFELATSAAP
ncbi:hypothetical protein NE237_005520 [Protea cynaroides]|uniref:Retrotransposon gag domain-containing protein n=1 Tax=Protea cynaroides TaxID=273540 RepID=A0A9Q0KLH5_9MAGN|nr:hypothetical protein NE237_005520 [Protea cynaroides]